MLLTMVYCSSAFLIPFNISAYYVDTASENEEEYEEEKEELSKKMVMLGGIVNITDVDFDEVSDFYYDDIDPLISINDYYKDPDPLYTDSLHEDYINIRDIQYEGFDAVLAYQQFFEYNLPFTTHFDRDYSSRLTEEDYLILTKIIVSEIGNCTFEQIAASAAMCLNRLYDDMFPDTMFENAVAPMQFRESYAYAPWPEPSEKVELAIKLALCGIDFSCNAVGFYTPEYCGPKAIEYFESDTTPTAKIKSKCEGETSVFICSNERKDEALSATKYIYSESLGTVVAYN